MSGSRLAAKPALAKRANHADQVGKSAITASACTSRARQHAGEELGSRANLVLRHEPVHDDERPRDGPGGKADDGEPRGPARTSDGEQLVRPPGAAIEAPPEERFVARHRGAEVTRASPPEVVEVRNRAPADTVREDARSRPRLAPEEVLAPDELVSEELLPDAEGRAVRPAEEDEV